MIWIGVVVWTAMLCNVQSYKIGVGIADITGPITEIAFMGYAKPEQRGTGLHLRQFSRSFIIDDGQNRLVFNTNDMGMMGTYVRKEVIRRLQSKFGDIYDEHNVMLSGTHTHSTPGGFLLNIIFDLNTFGFVPETFDAYIDGIVRSISRAHRNMREGKIHLTKGEILDASINRSPTAYLNNPEEERARYSHNVDKNFTQLKFTGEDGTPLGVLTWFAVHGTSMNNTNTLVSSDNIGYASHLFELKVNKDALPGQGKFVAAFASTNLGDVSPNTRGPKCVPSGKDCDPNTSTCSDPRDTCIASGPGEDMFQSTSIIAHKILEKAMAAWQTEGEELSGPIKSVHQYVDMPKQVATIQDPKTGENITVKGCSPAMGYSFAAGTTDGAGAFSFKQGTNTTNPLWNAFSDLLARPTPEQIACQAPKPILILSGEMNFPFEWQPHIVSTQLAVLGGLAIACVPGEFTTMSGRRMREALTESLGVENAVIAGLCNTYSDYITTLEEYQVQRYEGASTIYGPHTLTLYLEQYKKLGKHILEGTLPERGPEPPNYSRKLSLLPGVIFDFAGWGRSFGNVVKQPPSSVRPGQTVVTSFVAGNPRNNLKQEKTFLSVEKLTPTGEWSTVATDAHWSTKFIWIRKSTILGTSEAEVRWEVPEDVEAGTYRIKHFGNFKYVYGDIGSYEGVTNQFQVTAVPQ